MQEHEQDQLTDEQEEALFNELVGDEGEEPEGLPDIQEEREETEQHKEQEEQQQQQQAPEADELTKWKQQAEQWEQRYKSDLGRQSAHQRRIQELEAQIQQQRPQPNANPSGSGVSNAEWATLKEDFPEIAAAMEQQLGSVSQRYEQQINALKQQIQPIQQQAQQQFRQQQLSTLEQQHPDWSTIAASNEFKSWVGAQPNAVRQLLDSDSAADAAYLLSSYKLHTGSNTQQSNSLQSKRQNQLKQAQTVPTRGKRNDLLDDDALWSTMTKGI